ncbi:hypothetical protein OC834_004616 [Tilletia horrida]|uniref:Importin N-terminal domain-containing protein n=1 Tax=Tilletia horrida TaxID=155126 RepID=A0AAN6JJJ4_9BASI|nr:hypothetical protein OC835_005742 [Tilletia horrida]KAK0526940.1 hypothetical protein OC834_004616 [Tilletia horrida]KAK0527192.1 hypothetical protein OC842_004946 [Tilletia horrida]KAK0558269.1 hypothetical protein OC844_005287 [Tilletia horrida]
MAATWDQADALHEIISLIKESITLTGEQGRVVQRLQELQSTPRYVSYLVYIFSQLTSEDVQVRTVAGILLKNGFAHVNIAEDELSYIKEQMLHALSLPEVELRRTASLVVAMILVYYKPETWPQGLSKLIELTASTNFDEAEAAFNTLSKVCEDASSEMDAAEINGVRLIEVLIPKLLDATQHPDARIRAHSLNCLNEFVTQGSATLQLHLDTFLTALFKRASDDSAHVRRFVCQAIVYISTATPAKILPELPNVVEYMLYSTRDANQEVALQACEFWMQFAEDKQLAPNLRPYLPQIAPILLQSMVYSEEDLLTLGGDEDDAHVADRDQDIKPQHYSARTHRNEHIADDEAPGNAPSSSSGIQGRSRAAIEAAFKDEDEDSDFDSDDDYFDDDDEDDLAGDWNLRKCSAAALDVLAIEFGDELLQILLPHLRERLYSEDWLQRESGILALGAIAQGCIGGIQPHLPILVPLLINTFQDTKPLVRSIACWTLSRYSSWCVQYKAPDGQTPFFLPAMEGLLGMVLDGNKRVQEAGCSAFATLEEEAGTELTPVLGPILNTLVRAFEKYQRKNLLILYDAIGTLADSVGNELNRPEYVQVLLPPLVQKWQSLDDGDEDLIPLLECMSSVTIAVGPGFLEYSPPVFERCVRIVHNQLQILAEDAQKPANERDYDRMTETFIIVALDLLSGLTQGLGTNIQPLVATSNPPLLPLLYHCIRCESAPIRQSAYALLGDLAISAFDLLRPHLQSIMPDLIQQIEPNPADENVSVCNNAAWAAGEIALQYGGPAVRTQPAGGAAAAGAADSTGAGGANGVDASSVAELQQWVNPLIERLIPVLLSQKSAKSLTENAAVTIGRFGLVCPAMVAPHLDVFFIQWCQALWDIKDNDEKDSAFRGLCEMIQVNPNGAAAGFPYFCNAVVRWTTPSAQLNDMFRKILSGFRDASGPEQWESQKQSFPPVIRQRLQDRYGL